MFAPAPKKAKCGYCGKSVSVNAKLHSPKRDPHYELHRHVCRDGWKSRGTNVPAVQVPVINL